MKTKNSLNRKMSFGQNLRMGLVMLMCLYPNGIMALIYEGLGLYITNDAY